MNFKFAKNVHGTELSGTESAILNGELSASESCDSNRAIPRSLCCDPTHFCFSVWNSVKVRRDAGKGTGQKMP